MENRSIMSITLANEENLINQMQADEDLVRLRRKVLSALIKYKFSYNFTWFGRPIIQLPDDIVTMQELILAVKPELVIETGVAHGGSLVLAASMLELLGGARMAVGIDIEIRPHNRIAIEHHPLSSRIRLIEGSSVSEEVVACVREMARGLGSVMVILDSNHTHDHVARELQLYSPLVTRDSYLVVFDTAIDDAPADAFPDRPWGPGNNPKTAVNEFLETNGRFRIDHEIENRLLFSSAPGGYLKCIKD
jgi:cephalosporin hydroxylase